jgi:HK97 family phage major capsid protein
MPNPTQVNILADDGVGRAGVSLLGLSIYNFKPGIFADARGNVEALRVRQQELQAGSEALISAAQEADRDLTDDEVEQINANADEADSIGKRIAAQERVLALGQGTGRRTTPDESGGTATTGNRRVPAIARLDPRTFGFRHLGEFASAVRAHGNRDEGATNRLLAMGEGVGEDGGFLVPPEFRDGIMKVVEGEDSLLSRCDGSTTARNAVTQNLDETTPWSTAGIVAYWEGEGQAAATSGAKVGQTTLRLNKLFARVDVTDELLEDAPQLDNYLRVKAPEVMTSVINLAIISGNGVGKPLGFMKSSALVTVAKETSQPSDTLHHRNVVKMMSRMYAPCWPRSIWLMNQDVLPQLNLMAFQDVGQRTASDTSASPFPAYMPPTTLLAGAPFGTLLGRPILPLQGMETLGDLGDIALVDLTKYRAITKSGGARVDTSIHLKFDTDETVFRFIFRLAGAPWWSKPITPRSGSSNTLSAFVTLASR